MKDIQIKILTVLIEKYENSKSFNGSNKVNQNFIAAPRKIFPKYQDDAEYDLFIEVNESLRMLENKGFVTVKKARNEVVDKVFLRTDKIPEIYQTINREPKTEINQWLIHIWTEIEDSNALGYEILQGYTKEQKDRLEKNQSIDYWDGMKDNYIDFMKAVQAVLCNKEEIYIRDFSSRIFTDSKKMEAMEGRIKDFLYEYGEASEKEYALEEYNIVKTPTSVFMKGNAVLGFTELNIDLSILNGDIGLSTVSLSELRKIVVKGKRIITIENLTTFYSYHTEKDFVIYLGGFHNKIKENLLLMIYENNPDKEYYHFGDIDAGGFCIYENLTKKTGIPFQMLNMNVETLLRNKSSWKKLTINDRKRLVSRKEKLISVNCLNGTNSEYNDNNLNHVNVRDTDMVNYTKVINFMLEHNCKLEQEAVQ